MSSEKIALIASQGHAVFETALHAIQIYISSHAMRAYITFVLVSAIFSGILSSSEYFELRPAVYIEPVLADTSSFTEAIDLCNSWNKKVTHLNWATILPFLVFDLDLVRSPCFLKKIL